MNNSMDFGDLIMTFYSFKKNESVQRTLGRKYKYILVDEFQDTNRLQFELINLLSKNYETSLWAMMTSLSILEGAIPANIIDFDKVYSDAKTIAFEATTGAQIIL